MFKVGDYVRFKKPRNRRVCGTIVEIESNPDKVTWSHGGKVPMNIVIDVEKVDHANNTVIGVERVKTNVKKIVLVKAVNHV